MNNNIFGRVSIYLLLILSLNYIHLCNCETIKLNKNASCLNRGSCNFYDSDTWENSLVPTSLDHVEIVSSSPLIIKLDIGSQYGSIILSDNVQLQEEHHNGNSENGENKSWIYNNWPTVVLYGVTAIVGIIALKFISMADNIHQSRIHDLHRSVSHYFGALSFSRLDCCDICGLFFYILVFLPCIAAFATFSILLAILIPVGLIFGYLEHKSVFLWTLLVIFIQLGGILDLFADLALISQFFLHWLDGSENAREAEMEYQERQLFIARACITMIGAVIIVFGLSRLVNGGLGKLLDKMSGRSYFSDSKSTSSSFPTGAGGILVIVFIAAFWKVVLICIRLYLLTRMLIMRSLVRKGGLVEDVKRKVEWVEFFLYFDLVLSGIPLGIVTFMELFIFNQEPFEFGSENALEVMKLGALMIDLVGASFLFWYIIVGLIHKIGCLNHEHGGHHEEGHHHKESKERLLGGHDNDDEDKHAKAASKTSPKPNQNNKQIVRQHITVNVSVNTN